MKKLLKGGSGQGRHDTDVGKITGSRDFDGLGIKNTRTEDTIIGR